MKNRQSKSSASVSSDFTALYKLHFIIIIIIIIIMDDLTDDWPLTGGGETFELIGNYLSILIGN